MTKPLKEDLRNVDGVIVGMSVFNGMFETTSKLGGTKRSETAKIIINI
jgi:hypothetical protein